MLTNKKFFPNDEKQANIFELDDEYSSFFGFEYIARISG